jgi:hypothetical protein
MDELAGRVARMTKKSGNERMQAVGEIIWPVSAQHGSGLCGWTVQPDDGVSGE